MPKNIERRKQKRFSVPLYATFESCYGKRIPTPIDIYTHHQLCTITRPLKSKYEHRLSLLSTDTFSLLLTVSKTVPFFILFHWSFLFDGNLFTNNIHTRIYKYMNSPVSVVVSHAFTPSNEQTMENRKGSSSYSLSPH